MRGPEIDLSSSGGFQRTRIDDNVAMDVLRVGCHPVTVHQHNDSRSGARAPAGWFSTAPCSLCQPLITHMDLPFGCNAMIMHRPACDMRCGDASGR